MSTRLCLLALVTLSGTYISSVFLTKGAITDLTTLATKPVHTAKSSKTRQLSCSHWEQEWFTSGGRGTGCVVAVPVKALGDTSHNAIPILFTKELENQGHLCSANPPHFSPLKVIQNITNAYVVGSQSAREHTPVVSRVEMLKVRKAQTPFCSLRIILSSTQSILFTVQCHEISGERVLYKVNQNLGINKTSLFIFSSPNYYKVIELYKSQKGICGLLWRLIYS